MTAWSHPTRVRGLKSYNRHFTARPVCVAPYAGAWIEMASLTEVEKRALVAPYAGAWIEIKTEQAYNNEIICRTLRGCVD